MDIQAWQGALEDHHTVLNKHLETVSLMQQHVPAGSDAAQMLQSCVDQADLALQTFKVAAYRFMAELHTQALPQQPTPIKTSTVPIVGGVTGPTPAEQIQQTHSKRRSVIGTKRTVVAEETVLSKASPVSSISRPSKRARTTIVRPSDAATPRRPEVTSTPRHSRATVEESQEGDGDDAEGGSDKETNNGRGDSDNKSNSDTDHDVAYLEAVEAKLKEKEEKLWRRMVKKRKRSLDDVDGDFRVPVKTPPLAAVRKRNLSTATQADDDQNEESLPRSKSAKQSNAVSRRGRRLGEENLAREDRKKRGVARSKGTLAD